MRKKVGCNGIKIECVNRLEGVWFELLTCIFTSAQCHLFKVPEDTVLNVQPKVTLHT